MKKAKVLIAVFAAMFLFATAFAKTDYSKTIAGAWSFDMGGGFMATVEYKADGSLVQKMGDLTMAGTYKIQGDKLTTTVQGQVTVFTIVSGDATTMTVKRDKDGKTVVYKKK
ncbi:MAG: hypothetical protein KA369_19545 [Spirochaetes bacterium]|nr:hypothetical protein [Spirochaetota bacterium]